MIQHPASRQRLAEPVRVHLHRLRQADSLLPARARFTRSLERLANVISTLELSGPASDDAKLVEGCATAQLATDALLSVFPSPVIGAEAIAPPRFDPWGGCPGTYTLPSEREWAQFLLTAASAIHAVQLGKVDVQLVHFCCSEIARVTGLAIVDRVSSRLDNALIGAAARTATVELGDEYFAASARELLTPQCRATPSELLCDAVSIGLPADDVAAIARWPGAPAGATDDPRRPFVQFGVSCLRAWGMIAANGYEHPPAAHLVHHELDSAELLRASLAADLVSGEQAQLRYARTASAALVRRLLPLSWGLARGDVDLQRAEFIAMNLSSAIRNAIAATAYVGLLLTQE